MNQSNNSRTIRHNARKTLIRLATALAFVPAGHLCAQTGNWKDASGASVAETPARRSLDGFSGWLLVTPDEDWQAKWNTPSDTVPNFNEAKSVAPGKKIFALIFFANPKLDLTGNADILCDLKVSRPDRTTSIDQKDVACFKGRILGAPSNLYLSAPVISFTGVATDPRGEWIVEVTLKDTGRTIDLPLRATFMLTN